MFAQRVPRRANTTTTTAFNSNVKLLFSEELQQTVSNTMGVYVAVVIQV